MKAWKGFRRLLVIIFTYCTMNIFSNAKRLGQIGVLAMFGLLLACRPEAQGPKVVKVGLTHSRTHSFTLALARFKRQVEAESGGRYIIKVYYGAQLGSEKEMQEMLSAGSLEMAVTGLLNTYEPLFALFELPYLYRDRRHVLAVHNGPVMNEVARPLAGKGLRLFGFYENGFRHISNSRRPIRQPQDLAGLLIQTPENPAQIETFRALGAIPTPLSFSELYTALVQGVVDGQENPLQNIWSGRLFEAQKYISLMGHIYNSGYVLMGNRFFEQLPEADRVLFRRCLLASTQWQLQYMERLDEELEARMKAEGIVFAYPDLEAFARASAPAYESLYRQLGPEAQVLVRRIRNTQ